MKTATQPAPTATSTAASNGGAAGPGSSPHMTGAPHSMPPLVPPGYPPMGHHPGAMAYHHPYGPPPHMAMYGGPMGMPPLGAYGQMAPMPPLSLQAMAAGAAPGTTGAKPDAAGEKGGEDASNYEDKDNNKKKVKKEADEEEEDGGGDEDDKKKKGGLDLLASLALPKDGKKAVDSKTKEAIEAAAAAGSKKSRKKNRMEDLGTKEKIYVDDVRDSDVLCGRGGKSNHHAGNKRYRQVVSEMKRTYQGTGAKTAKTDLSRAIVEHVVGYGGRFVKREEASGQYFLLTKAQARRKTSQALRETKELKWTM